MATKKNEKPPEDKSSPAIAAMTIIWSGGYKAGLADGIRWAVKRQDEGADPQQIIAEAAKRFDASDDDLRKHWKGELPELCDHPTTPSPLPTIAKAFAPATKEGS